MKWFVRYQFGNTNYQPKKGIEIEAETRSDAFNVAKGKLGYIVRNSDFHFTDATPLYVKAPPEIIHEKALSKTIYKTKNNNMEQVLVIEKSVWKEIVDRLDELVKRVSHPPDAERSWMDNQEIMQLLHVSKRTMQHYRDSGKISFSQVGNKIYYKVSDVTKLLEDHYVRSKLSS